MVRYKNFFHCPLIADVCVCVFFIIVIMRIGRHTLIMPTDSSLLLELIC